MVETFRDSADVTFSFVSDASAAADRFPLPALFVRDREGDRTGFGFVRVGD